MKEEPKRILTVDGKDYEFDLHENAVLIFAADPNAMYRGWERPGIYCYWLRPELSIEYIGQAGNLASRVWHELGGNSPLIRRYIELYEVGFHEMPGSTEGERRAVETLLVNEFGPPMNRLEPNVIGLSPRLPRNLMERSGRKLTDK
jgi:hypothetical protein